MARASFRATAAIAIGLVGLIWSGAAKASTFDFNLTPIIGTEDGTGQITIDGAHDITGGSIEIDGITFDLDSADATATVKNGKLESIDALIDIKNVGSITLFGIDGQIGGIFLDTKHKRDDTVFALTDVVDPPVPAPLPSTWPMMLAGLAGLGFWMLRSKRRAQTSAFAA